MKSASECFRNEASCLAKVIQRMVSAWCVVKSQSGRVGKNKEHVMPEERRWEELNCSKYKEKTVFACG